MKFSKEALKAQRILASFGYYKGALDGFWGSVSKEAYRRYYKKTKQTLKGVPKPSLNKIKKGSLGLRRKLFSVDFAKLVLYAYKLGYQPQIEDVKAVRRCRQHMIGSNHEKGCAGDLSLFHPVSGKYLSKTSDHKKLGEYWENLSPYNRWGGRYNDGNHYERLSRKRE